MIEGIHTQEILDDEVHGIVSTVEQNEGPKVQIIFTMRVRSGGTAFRCVVDGPACSRSSPRHNSFSVSCLALRLVALVVGVGV